MIGPGEREALARLRAQAEARPIDVSTLERAIATPEGKAHHRIRMTEQTVLIPAAYMVTFSVETNHPHGTARHMSMSVQREGRLPIGHAVWMVAVELGFTGGLGECTTWLEELQGHGQAVNVVQYVTAHEAHT